MNGPEHYREAERLLTESHEAAQRVLPVMAARPDAAAVYANVMARAQVHATLALAAATADQIGARGPGDVSIDWQAVVWPHAVGGVA